MRDKKEYEFTKSEKVEIPKVAAAEAQNPAQSEHYGDFIIKYTQGFPQDMRLMEGASFQPVNDTYGILYIPMEMVGELEINNYSYNTIPKCYTHMDMEALNSSGITKLQEHAYLKLKGRGTAVVILDSGIDLLHPLFQNEQGSRITWLWDQTMEGTTEEMVPYGRVYTKNELDELLKEKKREELPGVDMSGHGSALAALAAGNRAISENFSGAAPEAEIFVVKLKQAKTYLREFYHFPEGVPLYQEDDLMLGISYAWNYARFRNLPLSVCLGLGSNQGAHEGESHLSQYIDQISGFSQIAVSVAAGNEGLSRHHFHGAFKGDIKEQRITAELKVGEEEKSFTMELWASPSAEYHFFLQSPTGERKEVGRGSGSRTQELSFVFVETKLLINYVEIELETGKLLVYIQWIYPAPGIWKIIVETQKKEAGEIHIWLPVEKLISENTYFLEASPYTTVTTPADAAKGISVTAWNPEDGSLYAKAGRGFTPREGIVPQLAAPGVGIQIPLSDGRYGIVSGTSYAAAFSTGAAALLFEWAIIRGNEKFFTGNSIKNYLQRGAVRDETVLYPNREWGYGKMNLYHTFEKLT